MDEITKKRNDRIIKEHLTEVDNIIAELIAEIDEVNLTPEMLNDIYNLSFKKWAFMNKYNLIKKIPSK